MRADTQRPPSSRRRGLCTTERAGAHSLQFGTYAVWTAGLLAALAVRPVPSCVVSLTRGVYDQPPSDVCSGQAAPLVLQPVRPVIMEGRIQLIVATVLLIVEVVVLQRRGRLPVPRVARLAFWDGIRAGLGVREAAVAAGGGGGGGGGGGRRGGWSGGGGGVKGNGPPGPPGGRYLSVAEREEIAVGVAAGVPLRVIAARLGRAASTVSREIGRNSSQRGCRAVAAQAGFRARRPKTAKLAGNQRLRGWVQERLEQRWSPEQISAMLKAEFPDEPEMRVSHEASCQSVYVQGRGALRRERPAEAADRAVPGHWEGDLIMGAGNASAIGTLVERTTRFVLLLHLPHGHDAAAVAAELNARPRKTLGWKTPARALQEILAQAA